MKYTTFLFDFDYTLADSSRGIVICFRNVLKRHAYANVTDEAIKRTIGKTLEDSFTILTGITDPGQLAVLRKEYSKESDQFMNANTHLFEDTLPTLRQLKEQGIRIGIISTKHRCRIQNFLQQHLPDNYFDIIVGGEDVSLPKPNPEGLLFAIHQLGVLPAKTMYVGDSTVDAETAANAGVDFTGVTSGATIAEELKQYPHTRIISRLNELTKPNSYDQYS